MTNFNILDSFESVKSKHLSLDKDFNKLIKGIEIARDELKAKYKLVSESTRFSQFNEEDFNNFLKKPYTILPSRKDEWFVVVPKFIKMNIGWLDHADTSYNVFKVNKFVNWLGEIPSELESKFNFGEKLPLTVFDGVLLTGKVNQDKAWSRYNKFLTARLGKDKIRIKRGREFDLIASLLNDGIMPFVPKAVDEADLNKDFNIDEFEDWRKEIWNRDYVQTALKKFNEFGAIGIYWAFSCGKTVFGEMMCKYLKGRKLIVVPTRMLMEQWESRLENIGIEQWIELEEEVFDRTKHKKTKKVKGDVDIITYASYHKVKKNDYVLVIFDECHRLPATTYSRLSIINAKYRIGLSATPYREDKRTDLIFALTGFPIGLNWNNLLELGIIEQPDIRLFVCDNKNDKVKKLNSLLATPMKTLIFCDSIDFGNRLSKQLEVPFIYGGSSKRLEIIKQSETCIVSRVGDEGVSLPDLERVIEIDFLFGSRRQEGQRMGRLFHGKSKGSHIILMTEEELEKYGKRLYAIYSHGFKIEVIRG